MTETLREFPGVQELSPLVVDGPYDIPHDPLVISRVEFLQLGREELAGSFRGRCWSYLIDRFQIRERNLAAFVTGRIFKETPEPTPLEFTIHPADTTHHWQYHEVNGLVVPSLREFVDDINAKLELTTSPEGRQKTLRQQLGYNLGVTYLSHLDKAADFFLTQAFEREAGIDNKPR